jgi:hypothetical protein
MKNCLLILLCFAFIASPKALAQTDYCPESPPPRLHIGERAEVASGIDRLRLRILPAVGTGEAALLYGGTTMTVLDGPSCNGGFHWWHVELDSGLRGWVAEGTWTTYYVAPVQRTLCTLPDAPWLMLLTRIACAIAAI